MKLVLLSNQETVKNFLVNASNNHGAEFLVSAQWASVIKNEESVETLGVYDEEKLIAVFNAIKKDFKFNLVFYYLPRGPVFSNGLSIETQEKVWQFLISEYQKRQGVFLRVEPYNSLPENIKATTSINLQPKETLMLNLSLSEEDLLKDFHPKTRYNIRLAEKKGVTIYEGKTDADFNDFWRLMTETGDRDGFKIHNKKHYHTLATSNSDFIKLFLAEHEGKVIAAGLFSFFGDKVTYLHGASAYESRNLMAPYLLQWTLIKNAKEFGYKYYDFYGIDEIKWPGVTRFKLGFGGFRVFYAGTCDIILNSFVYNLYNILRRLRRLI